MSNTAAKPTIVVYLEGGLITGVSSDLPVNVITLDSDVEGGGGGDENVHEVGETEVYVAQYDALVDPEYINSVLDQIPG